MVGREVKEDAKTENSIGGQGAKQVDPDYVVTTHELADRVIEIRAEVSDDLPVFSFEYVSLLYVTIYLR